MTWFKVDDGFHSNRKVLKIRRSQRLAAIGLWSLAGSWSSHNLTDGHVPDYMLDELGATAKLADALVAVGLWDREEDGYRFHNWERQNPTKDKVLKRREDDAQRKAEWRAAKKSQEESRRDTLRTLRGTGA